MRYRALSQLLVATLVALLWLPFGPTLAAAQETLEIYLVDVEGGGATLFVSPESETLLIDTGNGGEAAARDAGRIRAAMRDAGVTEIDGSEDRLVNILQGQVACPYERGSVVDVPSPSR